MVRFDKSEIKIKFWKRGLDFILNYPQQFDIVCDDENWFEIGMILKRLSDYKKENFSIDLLKAILKLYSGRYVVNKEMTKIKLKI